MKTLPDANKTPLTHAITNSCMWWLADRGFKPLASEVNVAAGWVADAAGLAVLTRTEAIKLKLVPKRPRFRGRFITENGIAKHRAECESWQNVFDALPSPLSCILEVKVSRADFRKDIARKFSIAPPSHLCYLGIPKGLIQPSEYPRYWGILLCTERGEILRVAQAPTLMGQLPQSLLSFAWSVGCRIDNEQRYAELRESAKRDRAQRSETRLRCRIEDSLGWLENLIAGKEGDEIGWNFGRLPTFTQKRMKEFAEKLRTRMVSP